jgi:peptidoglycan/xylan/chitin deacetylase (PgdA/CDA1 family)
MKLKGYLNAYHQWRYWNYIARSVKKNIECFPDKKQTELYKKPGIALSFDDSFRVEHWHKYGKGLFARHGVKATFNINAFHHFEGQRQHTQKEIDLLLELQRDGHEIAHHGMQHRRATYYSLKKGMKRWIEDDIQPLFKWLEKQTHSKTGEIFKTPVTYAFPHFVYEQEHVEAIVPKYFKVVRGHQNGGGLISYNHIGLAPSICIDSKFLHNGKSIKRILNIAKCAGKHIILTCHSILPKNREWGAEGWGSEAETAGQWRISPETLQLIIDLAGQMDLPFYTTAEIAGVATFADLNLEMCVREQLSDPFTRWIPIAELSSIRNLDVQNKGINNLDGIQYFSNLESLDVRNNPISDFRLLDKLPKLISVRKTPYQRMKYKNM